MLNLEQAPSVKAQHAKAVHQRMQQAMLRLEPVTLCSACGTMAPCHRETCINKRCDGYYSGARHLTHGYRNGHG